MGSEINYFKVREVRDLSAGVTSAPHLEKVLQTTALDAPEDHLYI